MAAHSRSRQAILAGAKEVVTVVGSYESNMNEIARASQVSRATLYNHFVDKDEMMLFLIESELERLHLGAKNQPDLASALTYLSIEISQDPALARLVITDPGELMQFLVMSDHPLWKNALAKIAELVGESFTSLITHWLTSQMTTPLTPEQSREQAEQLANLIQR
jgi:AcrR family transcriptional regulator